MDIKIVENEAYGPTVITTFENELAERKTFQHISLPATENGLYSAGIAKFHEPPFVNPPPDPDAEPPGEPGDLPEPEPVPQEKLDAAIAHVVNLDKEVGKVVSFPEPIEIDMPEEPPQEIPVKEV